MGIGEAVGSDGASKPCLRLLLRLQLLGRSSPLVDTSRSDRAMAESANRLDDFLKSFPKLWFDEIMKTRFGPTFESLPKSVTKTSS